MEWREGEGERERGREGGREESVRTWLRFGRLSSAEGGVIEIMIL